MTELIKLDDKSKQDIVIKIKLSNDSKEYDIKLSTINITINDLLIKIKECLNITHNTNKNIRLIYSGKLLQPLTASLTDFNIKSGSYIHVVINNITNNQLTNNAITIIPSNTTTIPPRSSLQGLDILLSNEIDNDYPNPIFRQAFHLSINEIAALRSSFRNTIDEYLELNRHRYPQLVDEDDLAYRLRIETNWLYSLTNTSDFVLNLPRNRLDGSIDTSLDRSIDIVIGRDVDMEQAQGSYNDFIWGFFMGFFLGYIMIFCIWDRNVTQRQKLGIISGVMFQLLTDILQTKPNEKKK